MTERKRKPRQSNASSAPRKPSAIVERHQLVADAIIEGHSETAALRAAGYHPSNAANVMRQEEVQHALATARAELEDETKIRRLDVLNMFLEAIDMSRILADPAQMINGADKIAKMMGYYAPERKELALTDGAETLKKQYHRMTDEELYAVMAERAKEVPSDTPEVVPASSTRQ